MLHLRFHRPTDNRRVCGGQFRTDGKAPFEFNSQKDEEKEKKDEDRR